MLILMADKILVLFWIVSLLLERNIAAGFSFDDTYNILSIVLCLVMCVRYCSCLLLWVTFTNILLVRD